MAGATPILAITCRCGRSVSAPCPTLADLPSALATFTGWSLDEHGFVRCPECIKAPAEAAGRAETAAQAQGRLF